jgi:two-component system sensor histidine kinase CreC
VQSLTHELKSPLAGLRAASELLREPDLPPQQRERFLIHVQQEVDRAQDLVDRLLALAAVERQEAIVRQTIDFSQLVRHVVERVALHADVRIIVHDHGPAQVSGEAFLLTQAVDNLLRNAVEFSPPGTAVEVSIAGAQVAILDHGPGVPAWARPRLGERFFALERPEDPSDHRDPTQRPHRRRRGSGLGLAFVAQVARLHDGAWGLDPAPQGGSRAWLRVGSA